MFDLMRPMYGKTEATQEACSWTWRIGLEVVCEKAFQEWFGFSRRTFKSMKALIMAGRTFSKESFARKRRVTQELTDSLRFFLHWYFSCVGQGFVDGKEGHIQAPKFRRKALWAGMYRDFCKEYKLAFACLPLFQKGLGSDVFSCVHERKRCAPPSGTR